MLGYWAKNLHNEKNITLGFFLDLGKKTEFSITLTAANAYRLYADGKFIGFGPQRAAHGYARLKKLQITAKTLAVEVHCYNVPSFYLVKQQPFFACEIQTSKKVYTAKDFTCVLMQDRVQKVPRYSYQRGFEEVYVMEKDRRDFYSLGESDFLSVETEEVPLPKILHSGTDEPRYNTHAPVCEMENGAVERDESLPVWRDRAHTIVERFEIDEWTESPIDEASKFVYKPKEDGQLLYKTLDFGRAISGFTNLKIKGKGKVYVIFDEILWNEKGKGENHVSFERMECASVHKWTMKKAGEYHVSTFDVYTMRYACVVYTKGMEVELSLTDYENPNADKLNFSTNNDTVNRIIQAARNSFAQNAVDIYTDCPSRERAGWLCDAWYIGVAERAFTGENKVEKQFLENYAHCNKENLPIGMIPMCYPSDPYDTFIPNWSLWYVLQVAKYAKYYGKDRTVEEAKENVFGVLSYFNRFENELGLLENLEGWVFVEWSCANDGDRVCGVNIPTNVLYAKCLEEAGRLYDAPKWIEKAETLRKTIKKVGYDGLFFVDNLVRNEKGRLIKTKNYTEVCQYYVFWFDCATKEEYPTLYEELMTKLGPERAQGYRMEVGEANVFIGLYLRLDLLMRDKKREKILSECIRIFGKMAERTGTLWEHNSIAASCVHGFASYAIRWIVYAVTGKDVMEEVDLDLGKIIL